MTLGEISLVVLGNSGLFVLIQSLIQRRDQKKGILAELKAAIKEMREQNLEQKRDLCRYQLLLLMAVYPNEKQEIMTVAKRYFVDLQGNWYASSIFRKYLQDHQIEPPLWFLNRESFVK